MSVNATNPRTDAKPSRSHREAEETNDEREMTTVSTRVSKAAAVTIRNAAYAARIVSGSTPWVTHHSRYANGLISLGLISLRPPQKTLV